ncbi:SDR family NAD(P)-dependent oxidoreductase [Nitrospiraceae bacterium AH_259_D15_M11_P09]|nr:SDR family NAD(P)-dependent oxidoreductase [Nitrospiraceae bacterium AH_259_D15_M11_P09]
MSHTAVIAGVGPGLGAALVRKFAKEGCRVGMFARSAAYLQRLEAELKQQGCEALAVPVDLREPTQVAAGFRAVRESFGPVEILVHHAGSASWKGLLDLTPDELEQGWRVAVYGGFLCAREAVPDMLNKGRGTILFTGATSSVRGRGGALAFSSAKFAVRGMAESLARELWPKGIHVAHVVIDGVIDTPDVRQNYRPDADEPLLNPDAIADSYWNLVQQERSAWTMELDLRPFKEEFFV